MRIAIFVLLALVVLLPASSDIGGAAEDRVRYSSDLPRQELHPATSFWEATFKVLILAISCENLTDAFLDSTEDKWSTARLRI